MFRRLSKWHFMGAVGALIALSTFVAAKPNTQVTSERAITIEARALDGFAEADTSRRDFGRLRFRGGLELRSDLEAFGGYSGLEISSNGERLLAVSDAGSWLAAKIKYAGGRPVGLTDARIGPILALKARKLTHRRDRDAEALRVVSGTFDKGVALIGFERNHRIGYFPISGGKLSAPERYLRPPIRLPRNRGLEAVAGLRGGRLKGSVIAFAERKRDKNGHHLGWLWRDKPHPVALIDIGGFSVTDAASDANGGLYVLERRFRWSEGVKMRVRWIKPEAIKPGAVLSGTTLIQADLNYRIDNMEGLAIHRDKRGRTVLTLISDDNFNRFMQRTLLLQFEVRK